MCILAGVTKKIIVQIVGLLGAFETHDVKSASMQIGFTPGMDLVFVDIHLLFRWCENAGW